MLKTILKMGLIAWVMGTITTIKGMIPVIRPN